MLQSKVFHDNLTNRINLPKPSQGWCVMGGGGEAGNSQNYFIETSYILREMDYFACSQEAWQGDHYWSWHRRTDSGQTADGFWNGRHHFGVKGKLAISLD